MRDYLDNREIHGPNLDPPDDDDENALDNLDPYSEAFFVPIDANAMTMTMHQETIAHVELTLIQTSNSDTVLLTGTVASLLALADFIRASLEEPCA